MSEMYKRLVGLLEEQFTIPADKITPETSLADLDMDSLAVVELFVRIQEQWNIPVDDSEADPDLTVRDVEILLDARGAGGAQ